jgi:hypothetical protein
MHTYTASVLSVRACVLIELMSHDRDRGIAVTSLEKISQFLRT